ncbi:unnamed protein product [Boreogadus saida]
MCVCVKVLVLCIFMFEIRHTKGACFFVVNLNCSQLFPLLSKKIINEENEGNIDGWRRLCGSFEREETLRSFRQFVLPDASKEPRCAAVTRPGGNASREESQPVRWNPRNEPIIALRLPRSLPCFHSRPERTECSEENGEPLIGMPPTAAFVSNTA